MADTIVMNLKIMPTGLSVNRAGKKSQRSSMIGLSRSHRCLKWVLKISEFRERYTISYLKNSRLRSITPQTCGTSHLIFLQ